MSTLLACINVFISFLPPSKLFWWTISNVSFLWCKLHCHWDNSLKRRDQNRGTLFLGFLRILIIFKIFHFAHSFKNNIYIYISSSSSCAASADIPEPSLATSPYRSSPLVGLQGYILYPHIAAECMFELVVLLWPGHMWWSIGVHHLWAHPCFSSSVLHIWFV